MKIINATNLDYKAVNEELRETNSDCIIEGCCGQRFIAAGMSGKNITIHGVPGNALGAYLNNAKITVKSNAQDAIGDTMNAGKILIYGNIGDAAGYAMRGGKIYVQGNAGYRAGIHMKAYKEKIPVLIIGGYAGSFLGEYQAGGIIIVLGLHTNNKQIIGKDVRFPAQVTARCATPDDLAEIRKYLSEYCTDFGYSVEKLLSAPFTVVTPDSNNPYKQMYVAN